MSKSSSMNDLQQQAKDLWQNTSDDFLSSDEVDVIYTRLQGLVVALDEDPLAYGPKPLQAKTALCRKHLATTERISLDVSQRLHRLKRIWRSKSAGLSLATKFLYANDPEVRQGRNISDREALAAMKLKDEWMDVHKCEQQMQEMETVLLVIRTKRSDLRDIQARIRDQVRLCGQELELGGRWGTRRHNAIELEPGQGVADGDDAQSVIDLIDEMGTHLRNGKINMVELLEDGEEDDGEEDDTGETSVATPIPIFVRPGQINMADLDDGGDAGDPVSRASVEPAVEVSPTEPAVETSLNPAESKTPLEALPSNGSTSLEIDMLLNQVQVPAGKQPKAVKASPEIDFESLLAAFE